MREFSISPEELRVKQTEALSEKPMADAKLRRAETAAAEQTFSGWLRRKIHANQQISLQRLEAEAQVGKRELGEFLEGLGQLTTAEVDAICATLGVVPTSVDHAA